MICKLQINQNCRTKNKNDKYYNLSNSLVSNKDAQIEYEKTSISNDDLRNTDKNVLKVLLENADEKTISTFSFSGLKIKLNLHQEILSRSLRRLRELKLIEKTELGYKATENGKLLFSKLFNTNPTKQRKNVQILQLYIPFKILNKQLVKDLIGKWFGNLRWIGIVQSITGYKLKWKDIESFIEISVNISDTEIIVETNNNNPANILKAFTNSTKIIDWISSIVIRNNPSMYSINNMDSNSINN